MTPRSAAKFPKLRRSPHSGRIRRSLLLVISTAALGLGLFGLAGFYGGPWLIDRWLAQHLAAAPGHSTTREAVRFNPITLVAEIVAFEARDAQTGATLAADTIVVDFAAQSLSERRPVISSIVIVRPQLDVASTGDLTAFARAARTAVLDQPRIERLSLIGGALTLGSDTETRIEWPRLDLSLTGFDPLSGDAGGLSFEADSSTGASVALEGSLAANLEQAEGQLRLRAFELEAVASRLGGVIAAAEPRGRIDVAAELTVRALLSSPTLELTQASLEFSDLSLTSVAAVTVNADRAAAAASVLIEARENGVDLSGRIEANDTQLSIRDARVMPPQTFTFEDAAVLATVDSDGDGLSLVFGGRLAEAGAGATTLNLRVPPGAAARRVSIETADLPATLLSAYARQALGRRLAAGSTDLGLEYALTGNRADGSLHITARGLAFAEPAADADGTGPSLELAAALLEDSNGVIEMDLRFASSAGTVRDAVADALTARIGAVTQTPFDTLAAFVDGADPSANAVPFLPGDAALNDRAAASVAALAEALYARPRLGMRIYAGFDATLDRDALARQQIELHVQLATAGPRTRAQTTPVDFDSARARDVLDEFAGERLPSGRVAQLAERFECAGALAEACARAYYEQIFDALVANEAIEPRTLSRLGRFRAQSIADALQQRGIAAERIELVTGGDGDVADTAFGVGLPVELTALNAATRGPGADSGTAVIETEWPGQRSTP